MPLPSSLLREALFQRNLEVLRNKLVEVKEKAGLDILTITDAEGRVVLRSGNHEVYGDSQAKDELVSKVLSEKKTFAGKR